LEGKAFLSQPILKRQGDSKPLAATAAAFPPHVRLLIVITVGLAVETRSYEMICHTLYVFPAAMSRKAR
jgi:hypothetical protein